MNGIASIVVFAHMVGRIPVSMADRVGLPVIRLAVSSTMDSTRDLREIGVNVAFDDFGTGNSASRHLRRLPIDTCNIDRSYAADIHEHPDALTTPRPLIQRAPSPGMSVTPEEIEHPVHLSLRELG